MRANKRPHIKCKCVTCGEILLSLITSWINPCEWQELALPGHLSIPYHCYTLIFSWYFQTCSERYQCLQNYKEWCASAIWQRLEMSPIMTNYFYLNLCMTYKGANTHWLNCKSALHFPAYIHTHKSPNVVIWQMHFGKYKL